MGPPYFVPSLIAFQLDLLMLVDITDSEIFGRFWTLMEIQLGTIPGSRFPLLGYLTYELVELRHSMHQCSALRELARPEYFHTRNTPQIRTVKGLIELLFVSIVFSSVNNNQKLAERILLTIGTVVYETPNLDSWESLWRYWR